MFSLNPHCADGLLKGRDRRHGGRKGDPPMVNTSFPNIRKGLQELFRHCERLLASALMSDNPPFTEEELAMMKYYADEIEKISVPQDRKLRDAETLRSERDRESGLTTEGHETGSQEGSLQRQWEHHGWGWWTVGKR